MRNAAALPRIVVLATGGTIAGRAATPGSVTDYAAGTVAAGALLAAVPQLADIAAIECVQVANIPSEHMTEEVWRALLKAILERGGAGADFGSVDGFVILHGTDTMEETAFFLDCVLAGRCAVPVVLTGAMLPADALSADGPANILNAVRVAVAPGVAGRGILVQFANTIHEAARVYKADALALDAFRSTAPGAAGVIIDGEVRFFNECGAWEWPDLHLGEEDLSSFFDLSGVLPKVGILYGHAGMDEDTVAAILDATDWRGIVYAGVGMGNIHNAVRLVLREAMRRGVPVVCSTRVDGTLTVLKQTDTGDGFISAHRLNPQKARVLLQLALLGKIHTERLQSVFDVYT